MLATTPATGTEIVQLLTLSTGAVVLECDYRYPRARSNLYLLDFDLREVWRAERPSTSDDSSAGFRRVRSWWRSPIQRRGRSLASFLVFRRIRRSRRVSFLSRTVRGTGYTGYILHGLAALPSGDNHSRSPADLLSIAKFAACCYSCCTDRASPNCSLWHGVSAPFSPDALTRTIRHILDGAA